MGIGGEEEKGRELNCMQGRGGGKGREGDFEQKGDTENKRTII